MGDLVLVEDHGPIRTLTLNRPEKLNALSSAMIEELSERLSDAANESHVRVVILAGAGRSFSAGYDLAENEASEDHAHALAGLHHMLDRLLEIFDHPKPILAMVQGHCLAGGCDLMMMCDLAIASEDAVFGQPEIKFGSAVVAHVMPWLVGGRKAKELILTGFDKLEARDAERVGLVNRVVPRGELEAATRALARDLAAVDPSVMTLTKRSINESWERAGFRQALFAALEYGATIESTRAPERAEFDRISAEQGLSAAIEWRDNRFSR